MSVATPRPTGSWWKWVVLAIAGAGLLVVLWACVTAWSAVIHGHPAYAVLLALTAGGSMAAAWLHRRPSARPSGWRLALGLTLVAAGLLWVGAMAWLRPFTAVQPALDAMRSDDAVTVSGSLTQIVMSPAGDESGTGVFFQPGALVEARAYAAVLRPLAEAGHTVVIAKQPLGIAFLALPAFDDARREFSDVNRWVVGGHSLGGVVAAIEADDADEDLTAPAVGLLLFASYPASDIGTSLTAAVLSISGSRDGLSTPEKIDASRADLPADATYVVIEGAIHAYFGDYGMQPGDGTPTISHIGARSQISDASVTFVDGISR